MSLHRIVCITLVLAAGLTAQDAPPAADWDELPSLIKKLTDVYSIAEAEAADPVDSYQAFYTGAIPGMLKRLDPHSVFFDPMQFEQLKEMQSATRKGFGSIVSILPGRVFVLQTMPGTPSEISGMLPGDEILAINNIALARLSVEQLIGLLSESRQREVHLYIRRQGVSRLVEVTMTPERMDSDSVDLVYEIRDGIGYIRAKVFEADTGMRIAEALDSLGGDELDGLILDLRGNRGGLMDAALTTAALFLEPGQLIVSVRGRGDHSETIEVPEDTPSFKLPMAVLIDEESASGSEIVAGAIQDHDRGVVIGIPSFGKGLVQQVYPLSEATGLALTTAYYFTPSGRSIQRRLTGGQLTGEGGAPADEAFLTDTGREVRGGGGIHPDHLVLPAPMSRLRVVLEASGSFPTFATEALRELSAVNEDFTVSDSFLDDFQTWLGERSIQPSVSDWSTDRVWIRSRLHQEIFNQSLGVTAGDKVELERDRTVQKALDLLRR